MQRLRRFWLTLETLPDLTTSRFEWKELLGDEWQLSSQMVEPVGRVVHQVGCPSPAGDGCPRRVFPEDDGTYVAVCGEHPRRCPPIVLDFEEIVVATINWRRLCEALQKAFELHGDIRVVESLVLFDIGTHEVVLNRGFRVFLLICSDPSMINAMVTRMIVAEGRPFILLTPTDHFIGKDLRAQVALSGALAVSLAETIGIDSCGSWTSVIPVQELFRSIRNAITRDQKTATPEHHFPTEPGTSWADVSIIFINGHEVHIRAKRASGAYHFSQMGMARNNGKSEKPTEQWALLEEFGVHKGEIKWHTQPLASKEKQRQILAKKMNDFFGIRDNPFEILPRSRIWRARFSVRCAD